MSRFMKMEREDTVATALEKTSKGEAAEIHDTNNNKIYSIIAKEDIPYGNKIALVDMKKGSNVIKYGGNTGECTQDIKTGYLVHVHNVKSYSVNIPNSIIEEIKRQMNIRGEEKNDI
ncbi:UxaA family hydrolase [Sedimentibacter hydroxybenzoicus DSM 7310]|uniref:UxaA family hydrolase n=1 Tax=Sedimentibacter hydroxybenzoicus DSM 7310 TaxID=1123245 RepID=A0A974BN95_SEDHY|nr:UxaA family hydrolase [Sedimentibacter hydroxybenzoicus]NYB76138.1 UxaA family hydrolase [Sedimentibacter hydroxybenzoicus DSM 7310]